MATVDTCAVTGTVYGQDLVQFQMRSAALSLRWKHVPEFEKNVITLSKLVSVYKIFFKHSELFRGYSC